MVCAAIALRVPDRFRETSQAELRSQLRVAPDFEYSLVTGESSQSYERFPSSGWLVGSINDLAYLIYDAAIPERAISKAASYLEEGVKTAASLLGQTIRLHPDVANHVADALRQQDGEQTRRMAMTIVANALAFHESLAGSQGIQSVDSLRNEMGALSKTSVLDEWRKIMTLNYWPIFDIARRITTPLPQEDAVAMLDRLSRTASALIAAGVTRSHDLSGTVFQRLVADRKFLATFYTGPSAAALLAALALPKAPWGENYDRVTDFAVADFACGTGTLLSAAYRRICQLYEHAGGNSEAIHPHMMERGLVGADVMPMSVHLTASMLASAHPTVQFSGTRLFTLPYGRQPDRAYTLGSLDLLAEDRHIQPLFRTSAPTQVMGMGQEEVQQRLDIGVGECDLVIMNPPFTRPTNHEGLHSEIPNPAFAAFGADPEEQAQMAKLAKRLGRATCANGNAGVASYFIALADRMVGASGTVALVLPLTVLQGQSWQKARDLWCNEYKDIVVVAIAAAKSEDKSFSADTGMGEVLLVARKRGKCRPGTRGLFVTLTRRPRTAMEASELGRAIGLVAAADTKRRLEDGPYGGTPVRVGDELVGEALECPLAVGAQWQGAGIADLALAQAAHELAQGRLWLPGQPVSEVKTIPITPLAQVASVVFHRSLYNERACRGWPGQMLSI
jgi:hypothetical protein